MLYLGQRSPHPAAFHLCFISFISLFHLSFFHYFIIFTISVFHLSHGADGHLGMNEWYCRVVDNVQSWDPEFEEHPCAFPLRDVSH
jgi:hypothetical protein